MALTNAQGLLTAGGTAVAGPAGTVVGDVLGSILGGIGSKYTKATFVQRFVSAQQSGDDHTAGALVDQAVYHGWIQTGIPDASTWQGLLATINQQASVKWKLYIAQRLSGSPALYDLVGTAVSTPVTNLASVAPVNPTATGAGLPTTNTLGARILDFFGLGPANQAAVATQAGNAAGSQIQKGIVTGALVIGAVVVLVVLLRRK